MDTCEESHPKRRAVKWEYSVTDAMEEAEVSKHVAIDVYQWLRYICNRKLLQMTITLGGTGKVVQIDESLFRHKPKVHKNFPNYRIISYL